MCTHDPGGNALGQKTVTYSEHTHYTKSARVPTIYGCNISMDKPNEGVASNKAGESSAEPRQGTWSETIQEAIDSASQKIHQGMEYLTGHETHEGMQTSTSGPEARQKDQED